MGELSRNQIQSTGNDRLDRVVSAVVSRFARAFPSRPLSVYMEGSQADGTSIVTSDLDLTIIFGDRLREEETNLARALIREVTSHSAVELDLGLENEADLQVGISPQLKLGSFLVYGSDVRPHLPLLPVAEWARRRMHAAYWLMINVFGRSAEVIPPLGYPDPSDPYFGYLRRPAHLADGSHATSTRDLIRVTGWIATALIADRAKRYVVRKSDCHRIYAEAFDDPWGSLLAEIYERCRGAWGYLIPADLAAQQTLREICAAVLGFERYFLDAYKEFVLVQARSEDELAHRDLRRFLGGYLYRDPEVEQALRDLEAGTVNRARADVGHARTTPREDWC